MVESFGGRVTGSVSGKTDILLVGKEPGYAKVSQAQSRGGIALLSLEDVRVSLIKGSVADAVRLRRSSPVEIEEFSAGISPLYLPHISPTVPLYLSRLFGGALTLHLAAVAARCTERRVPPGARFCRAGETYLILEGRCRKHAHGAPNRNPNRNRNPTPS